MKAFYIFSFISLWRLFGWEEHRINMFSSPISIAQDGPGDSGKCEVFVTRELYILGICVDRESYWEEVDCQTGG